MTLKLSTWLLVALAGGALLAGCGSSSSSTTSSSQSTPTAAATTGVTTGSSAASTPAVTPLTPAQAKKAVSSCKHSVRAESAIPTSAKAPLEKTCEKAASSGTAAALRDVAEEACVDLVNASHLPAGVIKERALATCKVNTSVSR
jgi:hypothetical protein